VLGVSRTKEITAGRCADADTLRSRKRLHEDKRAEVMRLELEVTAGQEHLVTLKNAFQRTDEEVTQRADKMRKVLEGI